MYVDKIQIISPPKIVETMKEFITALEFVYMKDDIARNQKMVKHTIIITPKKKKRRK